MRALLIAAAIVYLVWGSHEAWDWYRTERRIRTTVRLWAALGSRASSSSAAPRGEGPGGNPLPPSPRTYSELVTVLGWHGKWMDR